ncbi:MAG: response regulator [Oligoflexales bacterium]|nr:response regulator [Oligoflexales bacterium]
MMSGRVLIVEDSRIAQAQIKRILESMQCECVTASDGSEGIDSATKDPDIYLIIADINMPGLNGLDMCQEIRNLPHHKTTKIIMCTSEGSLEMKQRGKQIGVYAWVVKPINENSFKMLIQRIFDGDISKKPVFKSLDAS